MSLMIFSFSIMGNSWLLATRDALSVRFSHYFISYSSETTSLLSGFPMDHYNQVTTPSKIELPRSLVEVVVHWNMPMHRWLKTCKS
jgi:porcupine-like protein